MDLSSRVCFAKSEPLSPGRESNPRLRPYQGRVLPLNHLGGFVLGAGFEPAEPFRATVLQTVAIDHSAIPALRYTQGKLEPTVGFEPTTYCLQNSCSTAELSRRAVNFTANTIS